MRATRKHDEGFTLLELLTALAISAIIAGIAIPSLRDMTMRQRMTGAAQDLHADLALARSEAVTRATNVTVCPSSDLATCTNDGWANGRLVFVDPNANGAIDVGELVVKQSEPLAAGFTATPGAGFVTFNSRGQAAPVIIGICKSSLFGRNLDIKSTGHASVVTPAVACP
jgi:type IV fimbrial biogenesis protein FimT